MVFWRGARGRDGVLSGTLREDLEHKTCRQDWVVRYQLSRWLRCNKNALVRLRFKPRHKAGHDAAGAVDVSSAEFYSIVKIMALLTAMAGRPAAAYATLFDAGAACGLGDGSDDTSR
jgi:hypothetical protein